MSSQEFADVLLAHWRLLWPLNPKERMERINAIAADIEFEEALSLVKHEMEVA